MRELMEEHKAAQARRRELEAEVSALPHRMQKAAVEGDTVEVGRLRARQSELPQLYLEASAKEHQALTALWEARHKEFARAETEARERAMAAETRLEKRRREVNTEIAELEMAAARAKADRERIVRQWESGTKKWSQASTRFRETAERLATA